MNTILNSHRLVRWVARILHRLRGDLAPAKAARGNITVAQPDMAQALSLPRRHVCRRVLGLRPALKQTLSPHGPGLPRSGAPQESALLSAYVKLAVWRPIRRLHNKGRARDDNPLTSANSPAGRSRPPMKLRFPPKSSPGRGARLQTCRVAIRGDMTCRRGGLPGGRRRPMPARMPMHLKCRNSSAWTEVDRPALQLFGGHKQNGAQNGRRIRSCHHLPQKSGRPAQASSHRPGNVTQPPTIRFGDNDCGRLNLVAVSYPPATPCPRKIRPELDIRGFGCKGPTETVCASGIAL